MPYNLTISNVPGPPFPVYSDGAKQVGSYPYSTIADGVGLNITVTSYNGHLDWGIVVDRDIVDDPWAMYDGLVAAQAELLELATSARGATPTRRPSARSRPSTARTKRLRAVAS